MNLRSLLRCAIAASAVAFPFLTPAGAQADGWTTLFDGQKSRQLEQDGRRQLAHRRPLSRAGVVPIRCHWNISAPRGC